MFSDPNHITNDNYFIEDQGEQRFGIIGLTRNVVLLLVVFVERTEADSPDRPATETIHIISAGKADRYETKIYTAHIEN